MGARKLLANAYVNGYGVEVGAGNRPFPVPNGARVNYGDIRDAKTLELHFADQNVLYDGEINAETFSIIPLESLDFIISAHVIEHLHNPFGSIREGLRRLKDGGTYVLIIPDMRYTTDRARPLTSFDHLLEDMKDGGKASLLHSYIEHCKYVHPLSQPPFDPDELLTAATSGLEHSVDIHVHTWTKESFMDHLSILKDQFGFEIIFCSAIQNEAAFILKKIPAESEE
nr:methyltransferase domain-containing protein [Phyllobacterium myrsinacearum]